MPGDPRLAAYTAHNAAGSGYGRKCPRCAEKDKRIAELEAKRSDIRDALYEASGVVDYDEFAMIASLVAERDYAFRQLAAVRDDLRDIHDTHARIIADQCAPDEQHCTCVPALRARIAELEHPQFKPRTRPIQLGLSDEDHEPVE